MPSDTRQQTVIESNARLAGDELLRQLRTARESDEVSGVALGTMIDDLRQLLKLTPEEFARRCEVSLSTYYRWINGDRPPRHRFDRFETLLEQETPEERTRHSIISGDRRLTIRPLEQLLDRQTKCRRIWSLKHTLPYRAANLGVVRDTLFDLLTEPRSEVAFHCVFFGGQDRKDGLISQFPALESFGHFKKKLYERSRDAAKRLRGWVISSEATAFRLGLSSHYLGVNVLEYDAEKTAGMTNLVGREVDIFFEIPLAVYQRENHLQLLGGEELRWLELAPDKSHWDWQQRKELFERLEAGGLKQAGVEEFLATDLEVEAFRPRRWPE